MQKIINAEIKHSALTIFPECKERILSGNPFAKDKEIEARNLRAGEYVRRKLQEKEDKKVNARWELAGWAVMVVLVVTVLIAVIILG